MDIAYEIAEHIASLDYADLPGDAVDAAKKFALDTIGAAISGSSAPGCRESVELMKDWGGKPESTVFVFGGKLPSPNAAFLNSTMAHARDIDDTHESAVLHANITALPAAFAAAEQKGGVGGKELIAAIALGVDLACRLGLSMKGVAALDWTRSAVCGAFGATAAAAKMLGLTKDDTHDALGIVYSQAAGNVQCLVDGALSKRMQPAFAAKAGVLSANLAKKGITGARDIFEGKGGFFKLYAGGRGDPGKLREGLGQKYEGTNLSFKLYPCCSSARAAVEAALKIIRQTPIDPSEIEEVVARVSELSYGLTGHPFVLRKNPQVDAQFSIPYTVAAAISGGDLFIKDFEEDRIRDERVLSLAAKVRAEIDEALDKNVMTCATLSIKTKSGEIFTERVDAIKGDPRNPASLQECVDKFYKCIDYSFRPFERTRADELVDRVTNLEKQADVGSVVRLLG